MVVESDARHIPRVTHFTERAFMAEIAEQIADPLALLSERIAVLAIRK
jgi:hypothetical protein